MLVFGSEPNKQTEIMTIGEDSEWTVIGITTEGQTTIASTIENEIYMQGLL